MKTINEHIEQTASEQQNKPNGSAVGKGMRKAWERVDRFLNDEERFTGFMRTLAWVVIWMSNMCGWFLILGPIEIECTSGTPLGRKAALLAYCTAAVLLVVVSTVGAARMLPEDFFDE